MKILIIEDEKKVASFIKKGLEENHLVVDHVKEGQAGMDLASAEHYDVIILDLMLPDMPGTEVLQRLRNQNIHTPILILTAKSSVENRVQGLNLGADDYLAKPFSFTELFARVQALGRRSHSFKSTHLKVADLELDLLSRTVKRAQQPITLTPKEFALLELLMSHTDQVLTRTTITERIWDYHFDTASNTVDVFINNLRQKIDKPFSKSLIHTVRGVGYVIRDPNVPA